MTRAARPTYRLPGFLLAALAGVAFLTAAVPSALAQCTVQFCVSCPADPTCAGCSGGYSLSSNTCNDINECATSNGGCAPVTGQCTNTAGSRNCACVPGYTGTGITCTDVNECAINNGGCSADPLVTCTNTAGSRSCGACPSGYTGPGTTCTDINECATSNGGCAPGTGQCTNTAGSRSCACVPGYTGSGLTCNDINECATNNGGCSASPPVACTNTAGSFGCDACPSGYSGDGSACADINECATNNGGCAPEGQCTNTAGSRGCACTSGYTGNGLSCADVNECATNAGGCDPLTTCSNQPGSRDCSACPSGYTGTGATTCLDINECESGTPCNGGACTNGAGDFTCDCPGGVTGTACEINGYVPPDKPTAACEKAVSDNLVKYVKCVTKCRVQKAGKALGGKDYDEQDCQSGPKSCRSGYDKKMLQLVEDGTCPACLDQDAQGALRDDALGAMIDFKGRTYCAGTEPLAP